MNQKQLLEVIRAMKDEILSILLNTNLNKNRDAQRALLTIDSMFERLNIAVDEVIPKESLHAYFNGVDEAVNLLNKVGINPIGGLSASISSSGKVGSAFNNHVHMNAIAEITDNTMLDLKAAIRTARRNTSGSIKTALASAKKDLQSGIIQGNPRRIITQRVAESFAKEGMTAFVTVDGRKLPLDFYSEVVTRTNLKKANIDGALSRYKENGIQYVTVTGGTPTCHQCYQYRDIVFSLIDDGGDFPYLPPDTFPLHPNCNCSLRPYVIEYKSQNELDAAKKKASKFNPEKDTRSKGQIEAYEKQQRLNRINNYEKKRYTDIKSILGDEAPKTLGAYRRMKQSGSEKLLSLEQKYKKIKRENKARMDIVSERYPKNINMNKQKKHISGTNEYKQHVIKLGNRGDKPSILDPDVAIQDLVNRYSGTGRIISPSARQPPKESVKADRVIGKYFDTKKGKFVETDTFMIVYSKSGPHIYPKRGD